MLKLNPSKDAITFWNKLDAKQFRQLGKKIISLLINPYPNDTEELSGHPSYYRADCGEYRIIYQIEADCLNLFLIGRRNDGEIYAQFKRKVK